MKISLIRNKGFTLLELLIVLLIIYFVFIFSFVYYAPIFKKSYNLVAISDLRNIALSLEGVYSANRSYPDALVDNLSGVWLTWSTFYLENNIDFIPSHNVLVYYKSNGGSDYILATKHLKGDRIIVKSSITSRMYSIYDNSSEGSASIYPNIILPEPSASLTDSYFLERSNIYAPL